MRPIKPESEPTLPAILASEIIQGSAELIGVRSDVIWSRAALEHRNIRRWGLYLTAGEMSRLYEQIHLIHPEDSLLLLKVGWDMGRRRRSPGLSSLRFIARTPPDVAHRLRYLAKVFSRSLVFEVLDEAANALQIRLLLLNNRNVDANLVTLGAALGIFSSFGAKLVEIEWQKVPLNRQLWDRLTDDLRMRAIRAVGVPQFDCDAWQFRLGFRPVEIRRWTPWGWFLGRLAEWWLGDLSGTQAVLEAHEQELMRKDQMLAVREAALTTQKTIYEMVFDGSPLPMMLISDDFVVLQANLASKTEFGDIFRLEQIGIRTRRVPAAGDWVQEIVEADHTGMVWLMSLCTPVMAPCTLVTMQNMTDYFQTQSDLLSMTEELMEKNREGESLRHSLEQLLIHLEETSAELRALDKMKANFLSNMRHELLTPLVPLKGYYGMLMERIGGRLDEVEKDLASRVASAMDRQKDVTDRVLGLSLMAGEQEQTNIEANNLYLILCDTVNLIEHVPGAEKGVPININSPKRVMGMFDRPKMRAVLDAILSNAVKFAFAGTVVEVNVQAEGDGWLVLVANHGEEIPKMSLARIFTAFYQVDPESNRRYGGMGIGLHVAATYLQMQNCPYSMEHVDGVTTFSMLVPRVNTGDSEEDQDEDTSQAEKGMESEAGTAIKGTEIVQDSE